MSVSTRLPCVLCMKWYFLCHFSLGGGSSRPALATPNLTMSAKGPLESHQQTKHSSFSLTGTRKTKGKQSMHYCSCPLSVQCASHRYVPPLPMSAVLRGPSSSLMFPTQRCLSLTSRCAGGHGAALPPPIFFILSDCIFEPQLPPEGPFTASH